MTTCFTKIIAIGLPVVAGALVASTAPSRAADPAFCQQYANLAVHETQVNMSIPGCFHGFNLRWHLNWQQHYNWCLTASYEAANSERDYRRMRIAQCQGRY